MAVYHTIRRVTVVAESVIENRLIEKFMKLGAKGYTVTECRGRGSSQVVEDPLAGHSRVRIELIVQPAVADKILDYLHAKMMPNHGITACVENIEVVRPEHF